MAPSFSLEHHLSKSWIHGVAPCRWDIRLQLLAAVWWTPLPTDSSRRMGRLLYWLPVRRVDRSENNLDGGLHTGTCHSTPPTSAPNTRVLLCLLFDVRCSGGWGWSNHTSSGGSTQAISGCFFFSRNAILISRPLCELAYKCNTTF